MLAASCVVNGLAALLLGLLSFLPISAAFMAKLLPPVLQSGVMATVGWGIYTLAFDSLSVPGPNEAIAAAWASSGDGLALALALTLILTLALTLALYPSSNPSAPGARTV
jgi:hypothetical protein